jgi:hypothetical protein
MPKAYEAFYDLNTFSIKAGGAERKESANILGTVRAYSKFQVRIQFQYDVIPIGK